MIEIKFATICVPAMPSIGGRVRMAIHRYFDLDQGTSMRFLRSLSALPAQTRFFVQMNTG